MGRPFFEGDPKSDFLALFDVKMGFLIFGAKNGTVGGLAGQMGDFPVKKGPKMAPFLAGFGHFQLECLQ